MSTQVAAVIALKMCKSVCSEIKFYYYYQFCQKTWVAQKASLYEVPPASYIHTYTQVQHRYKRHRKLEKVHVKKFEFKTFMLKTITNHSPQILQASIFNRLQLNVYACISSGVMNNEMLSCVHGYHIKFYYSI